jgi:hypothetical protein
MRQAVAAMERRDIEQLVSLGIPEILIRHFEMVGIARVREDRSGKLFDFDRLGNWQWITPVCAQYCESPESTHPDTFPLIGNLVDLVAWNERAPERFRLRAGAASWLGAIWPQVMDPEPVQVWRSPLSWLRGNCVGLALLTDERAEVWRLLAHTSAVVAEDLEHARRIRDILEHPLPAPPVSPRALERRRHAA